MKRLGQKNICALVALFLAGAVLTSAGASPSVNQPNLVEHDDSLYREDVEAYIDAYLASMVMPDETPKVIKIFDAKGKLVLQGMESDLSEQGLEIYRQADYLSTYSGTDYYRISN